MNQQKRVSNYNLFLKTLTWIHFAIMGGLFMAFIFLTNLIAGRDLAPLSFTQQPLEFILPVALIGALSLGRFLSSYMLRNLKADDHLRKKLGTYHTTHLIRIALLEGVAFFAIFLYSDNNNSFFLLIAGVVMILFFALYPTKEKVENAIPINQEDQVYLRNPDKRFGS